MFTYFLSILVTAVKQDHWIICLNFPIECDEVREFEGFCHSAGHVCWNDDHGICVSILLFELIHDFVYIGIVNLTRN